jgi:23S rRNA pseudouridine2605 synthase
MNKTRIQKIIADCGYCSRRKAETYIESGRVNVNGRAAKLGDKADARKDIITINGEKITAKNQLRYIKMYKPRGVLCSMSDPHAGTKPLITSLLSKIPERVYPVGRLDANSEGLILLTNDGDFANKIAHPSNNIKKSYRVTITQKIGEEKAAELATGMDIGSACVVDIICAEQSRSVLMITISEGKNRQIRKMCEAAGLTVSRLKRVSVAGVKLGMLKPGEFADLTIQELRVLGYASNKTRNK